MMNRKAPILKKASMRGVENPSSTFKKFQIALHLEEGVPCLFLNWAVVCVFDEFLYDLIEDLIADTYFDFRMDLDEGYKLILPNVVLNHGEEEK